MIRSTNTTTKFSNFNKKNNINLFIDEYRNVAKMFIDILWNEEKLEKTVERAVETVFLRWKNKDLEEKLKK